MHAPTAWFTRRAAAPARLIGARLIGARLIGALLAVCLLAGCGLFAHPSPTSAGGLGKHSPSPSPAPSPSPSATCTGIAPGFSCLMQQRISAVQKYLANAPGSIGIVLDDRATGATWHNANATKAYPAASTIKLAMMTDLLQRNLAGSIQLTAADRAEMYQALYTSNDDDANDLWSTYDDGSFADRIQAFGMTSTHFTTAQYWGFMDTTAQDLDNLINYVLTKTPASIRNYLVYRLRHVSAIDQQWGVWGAGAANQPGNKDGWEQDAEGHGTNIWITNTVGFAGPGEQYTLAIMYNLGNYGGNGNAGFSYGTNTLTQISSILFTGHSTAQPHPQPSAVP